MRLMSLLAMCGVLAGSAVAQPSGPVQWEVIAVAPQQVIFFDANPDRIDSSVERSIVFTFHVLKAPAKTPDGQTYTMYLQRASYDCLKPELTRELTIGYAEDWERVFMNDAVVGPLPYPPGSASESISIMACDHFNPTDFDSKFADRNEAIAWAKAKLAE
jgi:hypothetical protein